MAKKQVFRFKISLDYIRPEIWRLIEVENDLTFYDFHLMIQEAMGWTNSHLHMFMNGDFVIGDASEEACEFGDPPDWDEKKKKLHQFFSKPGERISYVYDFGDNWEHTVVLESLEEKAMDAKYPRCLDGARACPPEDCGSVPGYESLLEILADPKHEEFEEMKEWAGDYEPEHFDKDKATEAMQNPVDLSEMFS